MLALKQTKQRADRGRLGGPGRDGAGARGRVIGDARGLHAQHPAEGARREVEPMDRQRRAEHPHARAQRMGAAVEARDRVPRLDP